MSGQAERWQLCAGGNPICPPRDSWRDAADDAVMFGFAKNGTLKNVIWWDERRGGGKLYTIEKATSFVSFDDPDLDR